jgi:predicted nucleotidyltransferase
MAIADYLARQRDVAVAYLFGSVAREQAGPMSDIDIAILLEPDLDAEALLERQIQLMVALDDFADREVQVVILNRASPMLAHQVIRDGILLYERTPEDHVAFEVRTMKTYFDIKPMLESLTQAFLKRTREVGLGKRERHPSRTLEAARRIRERLAGAAGR